MLQELWQSWIAVTTRPELATFEQEKPRAAMDRALVSIVIAGLAAGAFGAIRIAMGIALLSAFSVPSVADDSKFGAVPGTAFGLLSPALTAGLTAGLSGALIVLTPIAAIVGLFIFSGIVFIFAMIFGGKGSFTTQTYLLSIYWAPLNIISSAVALVPCLGGVVSFLIVLYSLFPLTLALQSAHNVTTGRAVAMWAVPLGIIVFLALCSVAALVVLIVSLVGQGGG